MAIVKSVSVTTLVIRNGDCMEKDDKVESDFDSMEMPESKEMWVDRYEPNTLDDIVGQKIAISALKQMAKSGLVTHMIFAGPPGVGKTTAAKCFAIEALGSAWKDNFEIYNASSADRGIDFVRGTKEFEGRGIVDSAATQAVNAPFKIIFLDEADGMTPDAQNALRGTMKTYSKACVFILACNYLNKVIAPIARSRCSMFKFDSIGYDDVVERLRYIVNCEKVAVSDSVIDVIARSAKGDLRGSINWLQVAQAEIEHGMSEEMVLHGFAVFKPVETSMIVADAIDGHLLKVRNTVDAMLTHGSSAQEILDSLSYEVVEKNLDDKFRADILRMIADASGRINDGSPERIQLNAIFATMAASGFRGHTKSGNGRANQPNESVYEDETPASNAPVKAVPFKIKK